MTDTPQENKGNGATTLEGRLRVLLPPAWRDDFGLSIEGERLILRITTPDTALHIFEIGPRKGDAKGLVESDDFVYCYRMEDPRIDPRSVELAYRRVLTRLRDHEGDWAPLWRVTRSVVAHDATEGAEGGDAPLQGKTHTIFLQETALLHEVSEHVGSAGMKDALREFVHARLPPGPAEVHLYFRNPCLQSCEFCTEPPMREYNRRITEALRQTHAMGLDLVSVGVFSSLLDVLAERNEPTSFCVTGNDWTLHPNVEKIFERLEHEISVPLRLCGPHATLSDPALAARVAGIPMLRELRLSLFSADPKKHDAVTGTPGTGAQIQKAINNLLSHGLRPAVNTVLTRKAVPELPGLLRWLQERSLRLTLLAFVPDTFPGFKGVWDAGALMAPFSEIQEVLGGLNASARGAIESFHRLPLCGAPPNMEHLIHDSQDSAEAEPMIFPPPCDECSARPRCAGVPKTYADHYGGEGLTPLS